MKMPGVIVLLLSILLLAQEPEPSSPSIFDAPMERCLCREIICDINVSRAIDITTLKLKQHDDNNWFESGMAYMDAFHAGMTHTVHVFSANADRQLASWSGDESMKEPRRGTPREGNVSEGLSDYFSQLFRDETYLYGSEASYLILRVGVETNKEEGPKFLNEVKFAISLPQTQKQLQIFIGDPRKAEDQTVVDDQGNIDNKTAVGARYFIPEFVDNLRTDFSAGFRGIDNPFAQGRVEYPINFYDWLIRPIQYLEYSIKREVYEESDLYFDRRISRGELVRLLLKRSTETQKIGMQYSSTLSYFNTSRFQTGLRTYVGLSGETQINEGRYAEPHYDDVNPRAGIYRYTAGMSWKSSFLRPWLFFEIEPRVDFDMLYNWRPNYVTRFWLEFYFGDI